jgi:hypothetical protein
MATQPQQNNVSRFQKEPKFLLAHLYTDAEVVVEPAEKTQLVAGMAEKITKKEYPDAFFKRAFAVFKGEFATILKTAIWFLLASVLFIVGMILGRQLIESHLLGGTYNFMAGIGVGYPGGGDNIQQSVSLLYGQVFQYVILVVAGALIIMSPFAAGLFYTAKRAYYQDVYKYSIKTYFIGFKKHWWKFMLLGTIITLLLLGVGSAILQLLSLKEIGQATAVNYVAVIIPAIVAFPIILVCFAMMGLTVTHNLTFGQTFKNAICLIANNLFFVPVTGIVSLLPIVGFAMGTMASIITYIVMVLAGYSLIALGWVAMADRGMIKLKSLKAYFDKKHLAEVRKTNRATAKAQPKQKQTYQNPKKKKKK